MPFTANRADPRSAAQHKPSISLISLLITTLSAVLLSGFTNVMAGQIYKWTDAEGNVHYGSEKPLDSSVEKMNVDTTKTGVNRGADALDKLKQDADDEAERIKAEGIPEQPPVPSLPMKEVKRRCAAARQDLAVIQARGQLRERDEKGNTRYVSEKEKQQRIKQANDQIREYCK